MHSTVCRRERPLRLHLKCARRRPVPVASIDHAGNAAASGRHRPRNASASRESSPRSTVVTHEPDSPPRLFGFRTLQRSPRLKNMRASWRRLNNDSASSPMGRLSGGLRRSLAEIERGLGRFLDFLFAFYDPGGAERFREALFCALRLLLEWRCTFLAAR